MPKFWKKRIRRAKYLGQDLKELSHRGVTHVKTNLIGSLHKVHYVRKQVLFWFGAVAILLILTGVQLLVWRSLTSTTTATQGGLFSEATIGSIRTLNPLFATTNSELAAVNLIHARLLGYDQSGHITGDLAASYSNSGDAKTWEVTLREGLTFHDGMPLTADDVIFTVQLLQDPLTHYAGQSNWQNIRAEKKDDLTIIFTLPNSQASFPEQLTFFVLPKHLLENTSPSQLINADFNLNPIGAGPFSFTRIKSGSNGAQIVSTTRFDDFYNTPPLLNNYEIRAYSSTNDIIADLNNASITASAELSSADLVNLTNRNNFRERHALLSAGTFLFFNTAAVQTSQLSTRQTVAAALNLTKIRIAANRATPLDYPIITSRFQLNAPPIPKRVANTAITTPLRLLASDQAIANTIAEQLQAANIPVELTVYEPDSQSLWNAIGARDYDLLLATINLPSDPDPSQYYHSSQTSAKNYSNYNSNAADIYLAAANATTDPETRRARYEEFLAEWVKDLPAIGLYQSEMVYVSANFAAAFPESAVLVSPISRFETANRYSTIRTTRNRTP
ncbi:MAG: ABC transporter substrate-binding protein [Candidatus Nomurabacteria bacterium]|jgi:peptide/nickel transport system substrate-binding protein|nr:ABC transporter substrate-binding protein [Candidatus Nomurabacteria bacterium]